MKSKLILSMTALLSISAFLLLNSCSQLKTITVHKTYSDIEFVITSPQSASTFEIEEAVQADLQDLASSYGFDIDKIESATINSISLQIVDSNIAPYTFAVVDNAVCSFSADGVAVAEVGTDDAVHTSPTQIDFNLNGIDVTPYLKASSYKAKMKLTTNTLITHDVPMKAKIECSFKVKPFK